MAVLLEECVQQGRRYLPAFFSYGIILHDLILNTFLSHLCQVRHSAGLTDK